MRPVEIKGERLYRLLHRVQMSTQPHKRHRGDIIDMVAWAAIVIIIATWVAIAKRWAG
jgi:hypothetical protein